MKLKLDENLGRRGAEALRAAGHDVRTAAEQGLLTTPDRKILDRCHREGRALVSLDKGLAHPVVHDPTNYSGIVVLRLPRKPKRVHLNQAIKVLIEGLKLDRPLGSLWLVRPNGLRIFRLGDSAE